MKSKLFWVLIGMFLLATGCAPTSYFGVPNKAAFVPDEFGQTEAIVQKAEKSPGAKYCPDKVARARELGKEAIETYWACRTDEAMALLAQSRKLAEEAMLCEAPLEPARSRELVDSDGDGVYDDNDKCPNTPKGAMVNSVGCPVDLDGDGVYDYMDQCPDTPKGIKVDSVGCPLDTDGDGVYDHMDQCPDTPAGATVDERGCWVLKGVYFDTDKWDIKPQYASILDEVILVLRKNAYLRVEIQGHTDSQGSAEYNQTLSENRAKSVMDYLIKEGISSGRLVAIGYGLSKPAFPNDSPENMAKNRRVELKPIR